MSADAVLKATEESMARERDAFVKDVAHRAGIAAQQFWDASALSWTLPPGGES